MGFVSRCVCSAIAVSLMVFLTCSAGSAWESAPHPVARGLYDGVVGVPHPASQYGQNGVPLLPLGPMFRSYPDYQVKVAYGRTVGTSTELDYATLELSKPLSRYPALTFCGPAMAEVQVALLASYVVYYEGAIEKIRRLDFHDGYELGWLPKGRFTFAQGFLGMSPYLESGAGLSYVSETYRNSGSRWNWSFLGGFGFERCVPTGVVSLGVQWRHLCNGNMWGTGDELHNSNSGTDMIQAQATLLQRF